MSLLIVEGWTRWPLNAPSNPNYSVILSIQNFQHSLKMWLLLPISGAATLLKLFLSQHHLCCPPRKFLQRFLCHHEDFIMSHHSAFLDGSSQNSQTHSYQPFFVLSPVPMPLPIQYQETLHRSLMFSFILPIPAGFGICALSHACRK